MMTITAVQLSKVAEGGMLTIDLAAAVVPGRTDATGAGLGPGNQKTGAGGRDRGRRALLAPRDAQGQKSSLDIVWAAMVAATDLLKRGARQQRHRRQRHHQQQRQ
mmetsp:Transcript_24540/g.50311  ORF Transcript_24540/g.50311 Transcript_24540/m.50311 type:complete len:105 (+) Transcript_24540:103-417(+)